MESEDQFSISDPLVSIVCLCYNTGDRLIPTLDAIRNQTYTHWELFIVDDASRDNSIEIVQTWIHTYSIQATIIKNTKNLGIGASLNKTIKLCSGKYFTLIGDDEWYENYLTDLVDVFSKVSEDIALVYAKARVFDKINNRFTTHDLDPMKVVTDNNYVRKEKLFEKIEDIEYAYLMRKEYLFDVLFWTNPIVVFCVMFRMDILRELNGFEDQYLMEDFPTWMKVSLHHNVIFVNKYLGNYNKYTSNTSDTFLSKINFQVQQIRRKYKNKIRYADTRRLYYDGEIKCILRTRKKNKLLFVLTNPQLIKFSVLRFLLTSRKNIA